VCTTRFWNNLHEVRSKSKDWKVKKFKVFGTIKAKGPKQDSQNKLWSPLPEGGEPVF
jgi:hypothetical protein